MTPGRLLCVLAGPLMLLAAACTSAGTGSGDLADALPSPGETQRLRAEANRITMRLDDILEKYRGIPDYHFIQFENPAAEEAAARIAAADACADEALK